MSQSLLKKVAFETYYGLLESQIRQIKRLEDFEEVVQNNKRVFPFPSYTQNWAIFQIIKSGLLFLKYILKDPNHLFTSF